MSDNGNVREEQKKVEEGKRTMVPKPVIASLVVDDKTGEMSVNVNDKAMADYIKAHPQKSRTEAVVGMRKLQKEFETKLKERH